MNTKVIKAFKRVAHTAISVVGDDCKQDLITIASGLGLNEVEIQEQFPTFYQSEQEVQDEIIEPQDEPDENQDENQQE